MEDGLAKEVDALWLFLLVYLLLVSLWLEVFFGCRWACKKVSSLLALVEFGVSDWESSLVFSVA